jgi:hypothetical protein
METAIVLALAYFATGAALFAHPRYSGDPDDFHWRRQVGVFLDTLPAVLVWPIVVWRLARAR